MPMSLHSLWRVGAEMAPWLGIARRPKCREKVCVGRGTDGAREGKDQLMGPDHFKELGLYHAKWGLKNPLSLV